MQGSFAIANPDVKFLFYKIFRETKIQDGLMSISAEVLLLQALAQMRGDQELARKHTPTWVGKLKEILHSDLAHKFTLKELSAMLQIHPVHLSRDFSKYFHCNIGEYIRKLRTEKAFALLPDRNLSLTDIALTCGFADQSHFLRSFKSFNEINPTVYRKLLMRAC